MTKDRIDLPSEDVYSIRLFVGGDKKSENFVQAPHGEIPPHTTVRASMWEKDEYVAVSKI
jgi:hypothetical protein